MKTNMVMWAYEGYWNVVLGATRRAQDVVEEVGLAEAELEAWIASAEAEAWQAGGEGAPPIEWAAHRARALGELLAAARRAAEGER